MSESKNLIAETYIRAGDEAMSALREGALNATDRIEDVLRLYETITDFSAEVQTSVNTWHQHLIEHFPFELRVAANRVLGSGHLLPAVVADFMIIQQL